MRHVPAILLLAAGSSVTAVGQVRPPAEVAADRVMRVLEVAWTNHVDPPPRQQLVHAVCRNLSGPGAIGVGRRVSEVTSVSQLRRIVVDTCRGSLPGPSASAEPVEWALRAALAELPGGASLTTVETHAVNQQVAENRYVGTGIQLAMRPGPVMQKVFQGGPADLAGARDGDLIEAIDGETTKGLTIVDVVRKLRGPAGSEVQVRLRQPDSDEVRAYTIIRGVVPLTTIERPRFSDDGTLAIVEFTGIAASTVHELRKLAAALPVDVAHLVLDFRNLENHHLHHARLLASALLDDVPLGFVVRLTGEQSLRSEPGALLADRQLVVLIGPGTSGTPEWIAAALGESDHVQLLGRPTAGNGYVHDTVAAGEDSMLTVATGILRDRRGRPLVAAQATGIARTPPSAVTANQLQDGRVYPTRTVAASWQRPVPPESPTDPNLLLRLLRQPAGTPAVRPPTARRPHDDAK